MVIYIPAVSVYAWCGTIIIGSLGIAMTAMLIEAVQWVQDEKAMQKVLDLLDSKDDWVRIVARVQEQGEE